MSTEEPSQTLYLYNLSGRPRKEGMSQCIVKRWKDLTKKYFRIAELKRSLYHLFITYGEILDIVTMSTEKMREQAFIVYDNVASATAAMRSLNGFTFHERPMSVTYARTKSHAVAKLDGTYRLKSLDKEKTSAATTLGKRANQADQNEATAKKTKTESDEDEGEDEDEDESANEEKNEE
ncbi:hypothetical protein EC973_001057 [Apophysomyces ossiformis]|uniref:RRM domain-containing protein n=1 Tax=Apophysomyces ossiformis TaxID=679940 RepID=A0A8H7BY50_9FUNG|nr:hypothetical protein EC973_001057 [Apophysomyces ossiformis]